jgi:hypothetical protein
MAALQTEDVLRAEADAIHGRGPAAGDTGLAFYRALNALGSAALCLSGGGIRSAAFALGVIQAFATHPRPDPSGTAPTDRADVSLLAQFHYLSTVSGGGYIGSWLSAWRMEKPFPEIWARLVGRPEGPEREPSTIGWLRSYSNYLTPKTGALSADTWAAVALSMRNLLLNWLVIVPPICAALLLLKIGAVGSDWLTNDHPNNSWWEGINIACGVLGAVSLMVAAAFTTRHRPSRRTTDDRGPNEFGFLCTTMLFSFLAAVLLVQFLASDLVGKPLNCSDESCANTWATAFATHRYHAFFYPLVGAGCGAVIYAIGYLLPYLLASSFRWFAGRPRGLDLPDLICWTISGAVYGALVGVAFHFYVEVPPEGIGPFAAVVLHLVFGMPWLLMSQLLAEMIFTGLTSYQTQSDADREWSGRAAGWLLAIGLAWMAVTFLTYFAAVFKDLLDNPTLIDSLKVSISAVAGIAGAVTAFAGKSSLLPAQEEAPDKRESRGVWPYVMSIILPIAAVLFAAALVMILSHVIDRLLLGRSLVPELFQAWENGSADQPTRFDAAILLLSGFVIASILGAAASGFVNINRFSLHALYRNRLVRGFLGASRKRRPDRFTGLDLHDNPRMHQLWSPVEAGNWRPLHVINIALNVVSSERLSWQERKAEAFTVSALHCGSNRVGYRPAKTYGGPDGITLGTAMAISGAAASPNMGYNSSPAITFLMTIFNVRLGWWYGNPGARGKKSYRKEGPAFAIVPLVQEALGLTTDDKAYVYLSDGGHFENLGLYEMVRRRCRFIVVSDAGCDPDYELEDLANAVRKIAIDLGIEIRFRGLEELRSRPEDGDVGAGHPYHAIGEIDYRSADGGGNGLILYIKAGYHGCEGAGIRGYAKANPDFPHQSTNDQWFTESQFESYRALGFEITDGILSGALAAADCAADPSLANVLTTLREKSEKPIRAAGS